MNTGGGGGGDAPHSDSADLRVYKEAAAFSRHHGDHGGPAPRHLDRLDPAHLPGVTAGQSLR